MQLHRVLCVCVCVGAHVCMNTCGWQTDITEQMLFFWKILGMCPQGVCSGEGGCWAYLNTLSLSFRAGGSDLISQQGVPRSKEVSMFPTVTQ